tara:strand:+ start:96 stop:1079 length:984 start_codon:yes stop_codon:yes gene_type:complete
MGRKLRHNGSTTTSIARGTSFKYDTSGNLEQIVGTVDTTTDDIIFTGTKSNLRRIADLERNVSILASQDRGDGGSTVGKNFRGKVQMHNALEVDGTTDLDGTTNINGALTLSASAQGTINSLITTGTQAVIDGAPGALDTLNELAAALGDDSNFAGTMTTNLAGKVAKAGDTMSGDLNMGGNDITNAGTFNGVATSAQYADLAERYEADAEYDEGTVMMFGGDKEVTAAEGYGAPKMAGVVSMKPAYLMNEGAGSDATHPAIALQGRVPVKAMGKVEKGDIMVASDHKGMAVAWKEDADPRCTAYIGIAIKDKIEEGEGMVEIKVGK